LDQLSTGKRNLEELSPKLWKAKHPQQVGLSNAPPNDALVVPSPKRRVETAHAAWCLACHAQIKFMVSLRS